MNTRNDSRVRQILGIAGIAIVLGGATYYLSHRRSPAMPPFRMPVPVVRVVRKTVQVTRDYVGTTEAVKNINLQALVSGYLEKQSLPDGSDIPEGLEIYRIDPRIYQAAVDQARSQLERDKAQLSYARNNQNRNALMVVHGDVSKDAFQQATSAMQQSEATVLSDTAALEQAKINLDYTRIRAPFSGRLGRSQAYSGTLIGTGTLINTLVQLDPIYATFDPPEDDVSLIAASRSRGPVTAEVQISDHPGQVYGGILTFLDNTVDRSTGTITARVTVKNPGKTLLPGQFVRVRLDLGVRPGALMVPQIAVGSNQMGKYLLLVGAGNVVEIRFVTLGDTDGSLVEVTKGVGEGDLVIVGNQQKIGPGMPVTPLPQKG